MTPAAHALVVLAGALALDFIAGEPPNRLHPVVWIGNFYRALRRRAPKRPAAAFVYGLAMALAGPLLFGGAAWGVVRALELAHAHMLVIVVEIYLLKSALSVRMLGEAASAVARALADGDVSRARFGLRALVSRDTALLDEPLLAAAAVESVAENASDSVVAPLLFFAVGGVPAALAYRACNTLDAMIGYHGETEWLGKAAARLDDAANLVPARVTAALFVVASALVGASAAGAVRVWWRDGGAHREPERGAADGGDGRRARRRPREGRLLSARRRWRGRRRRHDRSRRVGILYVASGLGAVAAAAAAWWVRAHA